MKKSINKIITLLVLVLLIFISNITFIGAANSLYYKDYGTQPLGVAVTYYTDINSRGFSWTTMENTVDSTVQYVEVSTDDRSKINWNGASSATGTYKINDTTYFNHKAIVYDLTPSKNYYYRVGSTTYNSWSSVGLIKVDNDPFDEFTFLFTTDSQQDSISGFQNFSNLVDTAYETYPEAAFMLNGGDITNNSHDALNHNLDEWIWAMEVNKTQLMDSVFMPVAGNHDSYGTSFADRFTLNYQGPTIGGGYSSFDYGDVHFVLLNTNEYFSSTNEQVKWIEEDLKNTDKPWKVILIHKGLVSTGDHANDSDVKAIREVIFPIIAKYEVDLVLQGHDHVYVRSRPYMYGTNAVENYFNGKVPNFDEVTITEISKDEEITYSVEPNGTFYVTGNYSGSKSYAPVGYDQNLIYPSINPFTGKANSAQIQQQMFMAITVENNSLVYKAYTYDGKDTITLYDQYAIQKNTHLGLVSVLSTLPDIENSSIFDYEKIAEAITNFEKLTIAGINKLSTIELEKIESYKLKYNMSMAIRAKKVALEISELTEFQKTEEYRLNIKEVRKSYLELSESERVYVDNYSELLTVEKLFIDNLKADAVNEMIELYKNGNSYISKSAIHEAYSSLNEEQKAMVNGIDSLPNIDQDSNLWLVLGIVIGSLVTIGVIILMFIKLKRNKSVKKPLILILLSLTLSLFLLNSTASKVNAALSGQETISTEWAVNENASDLDFEDVEVGGVGYVTYKNVPSDSSSDPVNNSITIPVQNYDVSNEVVSIKYATNMDVSAKNITLYALVEDLNEQTNQMEVNRLLIGWFVNWNVKAGKAEDGNSMITVDHKNYSGTGTVVGIIMNFSFVPKAGSMAYMSLLGIDFHLNADKPHFATDPQPTGIYEPTVEGSGYTLSDYHNGWNVDVSENANGAINFGVHDWNLKVADSILLDITPTSNQELIVYGNGNIIHTQTFISSTKQFVEINAADIKVLRSIKLVIIGKGSMILQNISITKRPEIKSYTSANTTYFSKVEAITDQVLLKSGYAVHVERNDRAGYPKFVLKVDNYRNDYDVVCINVKAISGLTLLGINLNNDEYLISHNQEENLLAAGEEYNFTYFYPYEYNENWDGTINVYVNPNSITSDGYNYESEFYFGITFLKSSDMLVPKYNLEKTSYEKLYDGEAVVVQANVETADLTSRTVYYNNDSKTESEEAPTESGTYVAKITIEGNKEYKQLTVEVPIVIKPLAQSLPEVSEISFDTNSFRLNFPDEYEVNIDSAFNPNTQIARDSVVQPGTKLYIRRSQSGSNLASDYIVYDTPAKAATPVIEVESYNSTSIKLKIITNAEYRIINGDEISDWTSDSLFENLTANTEYELEARIKNTVENSASDISNVKVKTLELAKEVEGCKNSIQSSSFMFFVLSIGLLLLRRKSKNKYIKNKN